MNYTYPHTIENSAGEKLVFLGIEKHAEGDKLVIENYVKPGHGPLMHTHFLQDEALTVVTGRIGYQVAGKPEQFAGVGETVLFKRGTPHRFWNAGQEILHCEGWAQPALTLEFFLTSVYAAQMKSGTAEPEKFDGAYLITRYASEYELVGIPKFVRKLIIPITYFVGKLLRKYKHFENAPAPVKAN